MMSALPPDMALLTACAKADLSHRVVLDRLRPPLRRHDRQHRQHA